MRALRGGDPKALEWLYDRHAPRVLGLVSRMLRDHAEAEETVVDVFRQLWQDAARFDPDRASPIAYLLTIARSRALDRLRARKRRGRVVVAVGDARSLDVLEAASDRKPLAPAPLDAILEKERRRMVRGALAGLSEVQREAIELAFFGGLSHTEIAERLDQPLGTVKTRIRQGLIRLRDRLSPREPERASPREPDRGSPREPDRGSPREPEGGSS